MTAEVELLRLLGNRDHYDRFHKYIKDYALYPETATLVSDIGEYYKYNPELKEIVWADFSTWFRISKHPAWKKEQHKVFGAILDNVALVKSASPSVVDRFIELDCATQINEHVRSILEEAGTDGLTKIRATLEASEAAAAEIKAASSPMVTVNAESLFEKVWKKGDGIEWRLEDLNRAIGPVRRGDLVLVGKRPEVGGTTFIASEFTHMVTQLAEGQRAIIFNNEEIGEKIGIRLIQSALNATVFDIMADPKTMQSAYEAALKGRSIDVYHDTALSVADVERTLRSNNYSLIAINVLDKVQGFHKLEGVDRLRALSQWTRRLADKYGVVFLIAQADATAEGVRYLDQSQLYGSKTGMQAESDVQLMIGKDNNPGYDHVRYFSIARNKTPGGPRSDPALRHGKFEVEFDGERGRFNTISWK